jgi:nitroimidazol reductase NimA-like FMN-containing flavoprotein (pyridoxamine 5'-phosphate oxidase superfamily)
MAKISQVPVPAPFAHAFKAAGIKIKDFKTPEAFERVLKKFLKRNHVLHLSTSAGAAPRSTPLEYRLNDLTFYILSEGGGKFANLEKNKKVSFSIAEPYDSEADYWNYKGLQAWATARVWNQKKHPRQFQEALKNMKIMKTLKKLGMKELPPGIVYRIIELKPDRIKYGNPREGVFRVTWSRT